MYRNGISNACYVGDTDGDEQAARFANIPFIWAAYGFGSAQVPDAVINSITELPESLGTILTDNTKANRKVKKQPNECRSSDE